jgi:RNA polymerase sigma-70 factor (ECF subfamily)
MLRRPDDPTPKPAEVAGRLYDEYGASLYKYALMLVADRAAAEDMVHQVFVSLIALVARQATVVEHAEHYLRRAVRNECYSALRRSVRSGGEVQSSGEALLQARVAADDKPDERIAIERALRELPAEQREVVHLKVYEGMTFQEIATETGESINTIASRYRYAIEKMKALLT